MHVMSKVTVSHFAGKGILKSLPKRPREELQFCEKVHKVLLHVSFKCVCICDKIQKRAYIRKTLWGQTRRCHFLLNFNSYC